MWKKHLTQVFIGVVTLFIAYVLYDYFLVPVKVLEDDKIIVAEKNGIWNSCRFPCGS